jgi:hypothetical protein
MVPPPGVVHALQVDRYEVLRVVSGTYPHEVLFAAREAGQPLRIGERYRLTLAPDLPDSAAPLIAEPAEVVTVGLHYVLKSEKIGTVAAPAT